MASVPTETKDGLKKLTTWIRPDQTEKLKNEARAFKTRHTRAPKLTISELVRIAIDRLPDGEELDELVRAYRDATMLVRDSQSLDSTDRL